MDVTNLLPRRITRDKRARRLFCEYFGNVCLSRSDISRFGLEMVYSGGLSWKIKGFRIRIVFVLHRGTRISSVTPFVQSYVSIGLDNE